MIRCYREELDMRSRRTICVEKWSGEQGGHILQHTVDIDTVARSGFVNENMRYGAQQLPILNDGTAAHPLYDTACFGNQRRVVYRNGKVVGIVCMQRGDGDAVATGFPIVKRTPDIRISLRKLCTCAECKRLFRYAIVRDGI